MQEFELTSENREGYLFVKGHGFRKNFQAVFESGQELSALIQQNNTRFLLLDYSGLVTQITSADIFNITRLYESKTPVLFKVTIGIVINPAEAHLEEFWEDICRKRGFDFKTFLKIEEAEKWLVQRIYSERNETIN